MSIKSIADSVKNRQTTATELVEAAIERAKKISSKNALISTTSVRALKRASQIDQSIADDVNPGKLAGVPFVVKDNFLAFGAPTTAASKMLENYDTPLQATAVEKLEAEGAICIGKANLDAFANGGSTENSFFNVTKNAHDDNKVAGGTSGGSAVVTALDVVPFALGTDTGGSIRQPAAFNGVYGFKPTYGAVSRFGVVAMASSTDTIGCFTRSAEDTDLIMQIIAGRDDQDMTTVQDFYNDEPVKQRPLKIGLIKETMSDEVEPKIRRALDIAVNELKRLDHTVDEVSMPMSKHALAMYYIIMPAELSSNLARYDGIRYGHRAKDIQTLAELYGKSRDEGFVTENKRRIMIGSYVLSSGFYEAYYHKAQQARTLLRNEFDKLFEKYDVLLSPTTPTTAFGIGENSMDPIKMYLADVMTVPPSLAGLPALSLPAGSDENNLPIGLQLVGNQRSDQLIIDLARQLEGVTWN